MDDIAAVELKQAHITIKKLERELNLAQTAIERNKVAAAAKENLSKIIEEKKSELEMYMNLLLENCPDIIMLFNREGKIAYCTEAFLRIAGISGFGMLAGSHYRDILLKYSPPAFVEEADRIYNRTGASPAILHQSLDFSGKGNFREYTIQISPMRDDQGNDSGAMMLFYDTTDLLEAKHEAEKANKAKSDFLATVSHEIRTPMNAIIGLSSMLENSGLNTEQKKYVKNIQNSSRVLLNLINDILDFSKIEAGKLELINEYFSLNHLLSNLKEMFDLLFPEKDLNFQCVFAKDLPEVVFGDEKRIGQILTNLLNNAYKYTRQGGVTFRVELLPPAQDAQQNNEDILRFVVDDTGIGMKEDAIPRLFTAFEQLDLVRNKQVQGTGLGLAITKRLCDMMSGKITVTSVYDKGSTFSVTLPLKRGTTDDLSSEELTVISFTAPAAKALLVDDIDINLEIAAYMFNSFGITPDTAKGGAESVEMTQQKNYDIIFMDHMMPGMDGIEAVKHIRSLGGNNALTPIIALTANVVSGAKEMFLSNGFNGILSKPMDPKALAETFLRYLPPNLIKKITAR
jgi:PAS domain S-box-containing protein